MRPSLPLVVALAVAGCVAPGPVSDAPVEGLVGAVVPGFVQEHDHADPALHAFSQGLEEVAYHAMVPGEDGAGAEARGGAWLNSELVVRGSTAFVAYLGAPWLVGAVDVSDPSAPKLLDALEFSNAWGMDVTASDDGAWIYVSVYPGAVGTLFDPRYVLENVQRPDAAALPGVAIVDARDPSKLALAGFHPIHGLGPHTAVYHRYADGREVVFADKADAPGGNGIVALEVVPTPTGGRALRPVSFFALEGPLEGTFPHDVHVQEHPLDGRTLLYAAWWDNGLVVLDVSDPAKPTLVSRFDGIPRGEEVQLHDVHPFPRLVAGRHYTLSGPEIPGGDTSGHLRVYDTTDPAAPSLVGSWILPGEFVVDSPFLFSVHNFDFLPDGRVALAHGHAGVWIVDWLGPGGVEAPDPAWMAAPRAVGYDVPHPEGAAAPVWSPVAGVPWMWGTAVGPDGTVWAVDVVSGLHALRVS